MLPSVYLSPSLEGYNSYFGGGNEQYYMNLIVDEMIPYLVSSGITYQRNDPNQTLSANVANANFGNYNLYLSLTSSYELDKLSKINGKIEINIFHLKDSFDGKRCADIISKNIQNIYPKPTNVNVIGTLEIGEINFSVTVAVLVDFGNHNDPIQANWIRQNVEEIGKNLAFSLTQYFVIPFIEPGPKKAGISNSRFLLMNRPNVYSEIIATIPPKVTIMILGEWNDWYVATYSNKTGYAQKKYVDIIN